MFPPVTALLRRLACKAGFGLAALLALLTGAGFLLAALWTALDAARAPLFASLVIGLGLTGLALVLAVVGFAPRRPPRQAELDAATLEALNRAAAGGPGDMERALREVLTAHGMTPPAAGNLPSVLAAFVFGVTLALTRDRRR